MERGFVWQGVREQVGNEEPKYILGPDLRICMRLIIVRIYTSASLMLLFNTLNPVHIIPSSFHYEPFFSEAAVSFSSLRFLQALTSFNKLITRGTATGPRRGK